MLIGERIRDLREVKNLSQGDIQERSGLLRPYLSRIENGHTVPSVETLEKFARALEVPLYQLFYEGKEQPKSLGLLKRKTADEIVWGRSKKEIRYWRNLCRLFSRLDEADRQLLLHLAQQMAMR